MSNDNTAASLQSVDHSRGVLPRSDGLAIAEGVILLCGLALLNHTGLMPFDVFPVHPYLFAVILLSAQYGLYGGLLSAFGAIALVHGGGMPVRAIDMSYAQYFQLAWADSLSWVLAALMVGLVTTRRSRALKAQASKLQSATVAQSIIAAQYQVLAQRTHELERSLAGRREPVEAMAPVQSNSAQGPRSARLVQTAG
ncbi:hypothetical protein [Devosia rhizoryzae]|uniref:Uncharacterized protein n=1 Tax=Devosia rhizoryzae TaxID=2774137 RepID=A0ABX7C825_9HYPH|nr:hypothetical protein [Devosia rhizoryzae]QQR40410.1 hypothetical protein JI748_05235 [Devosia rhizoryzae]